ncbi:MAG: tyrosine-type recombinase/integrase [bacterium]
MSEYLNYLPDVLNEFEEEDLLAQPNLKTFTGFRNYVLMRLILNTGLITDEIRNLKWEDVKIYEGILFVRKDDIRKNRRVYFDFETLEALRDLKKRQSIEIGSYPHVFTTMDGKPLLKRYICQMVKRYVNRAYITKDINPYSLRHTYAMKLYKKTQSLKQIRKELGLAETSNVGIYRLLANEELSHNY